MIVRVKALAFLREAIGGFETRVEVPGRSSISVGELLEILAERYPRIRDLVGDPLEALGDLLHVLVNGRNVIHMNGPKTLIRDGDTVVLFPLAGGG
ncbi:MAG: MoaD family protein [Pyrodictiaceae archaeon]